MAPAVLLDGSCPLCGQYLVYFCWPIDAFVCPDDAVSWSSIAALDGDPGLLENQADISR
jgi:hypothetical protein